MDILNDPYIYVPLLCLIIFLLLLLTDTIQLNLFNQKDGFTDSYNNIIEKGIYQQQSDMGIVNLDGKIKIKRINEVIDTLVQYDEVHTLSALNNMRKYILKPENKAHKKNYELILERYESTKLIMKDSIKYLEGLKRQGKGSGEGPSSSGIFLAEEEVPNMEDIVEEEKEKNKNFTFI